MSEKNTYKCISCNKEGVGIFNYDTSDFIGQIWLRLCSQECFYEIMNDFIYQFHYHQWKDFLYDLQNEDDIAAHKKIIDDMIRSIKENPLDKKMLTHPVPSFLNNFLKDLPPPKCSAGVKIRRVPVEMQIKYTTDRIENLQMKLKDEMEHLEFLKSRPQKDKSDE